MSCTMIPPLFSNSAPSRLRVGILALAVLSVALVCRPESYAAEPEFNRVSDDKRGFVQEKSGQPFVPWGFNYDHDEAGRLIEDYWQKEWPKVDEDFAEMKRLGANVVGIPIQFGKVMETAGHPKAPTTRQ